MVMGAALGPFPFGLIHDLKDSFTPAFYLFSILPLIGGIWIWKISRDPVNIEYIEEF